MVAANSDTETVTVMYGSQTFRESSGKVNVFAMKADKSARRVFPGEKLEYVRKPWNTAASTDGYEGHGTWTTGSFHPKDGVILMIQASTSIQGAPYNTGMQLIALRSTAPLIQVSVLLRPNHEATYSEALPAFVGRGDLLAYGELKDYGVILHDRDRGYYFNETELSELFNVVTLAPGVDKPELVTVRVPGGGMARVPIDNTPKRKIRIRRP